MYAITNPTKNNELNIIEIVPSNSILFTPFYKVIITAIPASKSNTTIINPDTISILFTPLCCVGLCLRCGIRKRC